MNISQYTTILSKTEKYIIAFFLFCIFLILLSIGARIFLFERTKSFLFIPEKLISFQIFPLKYQGEEFSSAKKSGHSFVSKIEFFNMQNQKRNIFLLENSSLSKMKEYLSFFMLPLEETQEETQNDMTFLSVTGKIPHTCVFIQEQKSTLCGLSKTHIEDFLETKKILEKETEKFKKWYSKKFRSFSLFGENFLDSPLHSNIEHIIVFEKNTTKEINMILFPKTPLSVSEKRKKPQNLLSYFPRKDTQIFFAGYDFSSEWKGFLETLHGQNSEYEIIVRGILRQKIHSLFGADIEFDTHILPLFQETYSFGLLKYENNFTPLFVFPFSTFSQIETLINSYYHEKGTKYTDIQEYSLENTSVKQITLGENPYKKIEERIGAGKILGYFDEETQEGIFFGKRGTDILLSFQSEVLKKSLSLPEENIRPLFFGTKSADIGFMRKEIFENIQDFFPIIKNYSLSLFKNDIIWESQKTPHEIFIRFAEVEDRMTD